MIEVENFDIYSFEKSLGNKNNIPDEKGIYAWYLDFSKFKNFSTVDEFAEKMNLLNSLISLDKLNGSVKSFFRKYNVEINENRSFIEKFYIEETEEEIIYGDKIQDLSLKECRELMDLLANFSLLVNPLYVGITVSFRKRYGQHQKSFLDIKKMRENNEEEELILEKGLKSFGGRIASKDFKWEYLIFACVKKDIDRKIIGNAEFLINRFYNPLFGRR